MASCVSTKTCSSSSNAVCHENTLACNHCTALSRDRPWTTLEDLAHSLMEASHAMTSRHGAEISDDFFHVWDSSSQSFSSTHTHTHIRKHFRTPMSLLSFSHILLPFPVCVALSFPDHAQTQHRGARRARCVSRASLFHAGNPTSQILTSVWEASACPCTLPRTFSHPGCPILERCLMKDLRVRPEGHLQMRQMGARREGARDKRTRRQG